jgi:hypothetical protein
MLLVKELPCGATFPHEDRSAAAWLEHLQRAA